MWGVAAATSRGWRGTTRPTAVAEVAPAQGIRWNPRHPAPCDPSPPRRPPNSAASLCRWVGARGDFHRAGYIYGYPLLAVQRVQALLGPLNTLNLNTSFANPDAEPFWKAIGGGMRRTSTCSTRYGLARSEQRSGRVVRAGYGRHPLPLPADRSVHQRRQLHLLQPHPENPIGGQGPGTYAITWIGNQVDVPGAQTVLVDYPSELLLGRVEATPEDQQQVVDLMYQWTLTPTGATSVNNAVIPLRTWRSLRAQRHQHRDHPEFAVPAEQDAATLAALAKIGVGPDPPTPRRRCRSPIVLELSQLSAHASRSR